jgi:hypothetical protein
MMPLVWMAFGQPLAPSGFGRFGRINEDGLLTLNITPTGFTSPSPTSTLRGRFGSEQATPVLKDIARTHKTLQLNSGSPGEPTEIHYTLLYPGFSAVFSSQLKLKLTMSGSPVFSAEARLAEVSPNSCFWLLLRPLNVKGVPLGVAFRPGYTPKSWRLALESGVYTLNIEDADGIGEVRFFTPWGLKELPAAPSPAELDALRASTEEWAQRPVPRHLQTEYALSEDGRSVSIVEQYAPVESGAIAPLPPVLAFAIEKGYPATVRGEVLRGDCLTKYGPFAYLRGSRAEYSLPVPPTEERGYVKVSGNTEGINLLNNFVGHLGGSWVTNAVDMAYAGMANAHMAWPYLTTANRTAVTNAWKTYLPMGFLMPPYEPSAPKQPWKEETEPFSGLNYIWTYKIDGWGPYRYDLDWGNALPLYGLYKYAQFTGDWDFVRARWQAVRRIYQYFDIADDWAWMTVTNGDHGYSTGTGDPMAATYGGMLACLKMARALGDRRAEELFAYRTARICVPVVARFWYTGWARERGWISSRSVVIGFWEDRHFVSASLGTEDPWSSTNVLSGDGILPEFFDALTAYAPQALRDYEDDYARYFTSWDDGNYSYPFNTTYNGNSVYVTFPHIFARAVLGESTEALWGYIQRAKTNTNNAWVGPNVVAELLSRPAPLVLTEWRPAAYRDGSLSTDGKTVALSFSVSQSTSWSFEARMLNQAVPAQVRIGTTNVPFTFEQGKLRASDQVSGNFTVQITLQ